MAQLKNFDLVKPLDMHSPSLRAEWKRFKREFNCYININELDKKSDSIKIGYLTLLIGTEAAELIEELATAEEDKKDIKKLIQAYDEYFNPTTNLYIQRMKFYQRNQKVDESFNEFLLDVRKLASTCEFDKKDEAVRDRIVFGMKNEKIREKIIFSKEFSLNAVVEKVRLYEIQKNELNQVNENVSSKVDQLSRNNKCQKCSYNHPKEKCPARDKKCLKCKKNGHFASCCKSKKVDAMEEEDVEIVRSDSVRYVRSLSWFKDLNIDGQFIKFKLDSGAQINTINEGLYMKFKQKHKLLQTKIKIQAYFGGMMNPLGKVILPIKINKNVYREEFIVIKGNFEPLLGLTSCLKLNLISRLDAIHVNKSKELKDERQEFIDHYHRVFEGLGKFDRNFKMHIKDNAVPFAGSPRRIPLKLKDKVLIKLNEMEELGVISKVNEPREWINNIVIVEKGEKIRICIDPKHLNESLKDFRYPIPSLNELRQDLKDAKYFSVLDLKDGFWHIDLDEDSRKLCSFSTPFGLYQFNRLPFGIKIASEIFQKYMSDTFGDLKGVKFYIDDLIIFGKDLDEHDLNIKAVMLRAKEKGIKFNSKKVQFTESSVKFFGHIFSENEVRVDPERIESISTIPVPLNKHDVQKFLGVVNYMRDFIPNLPKLTQNIRNLLKKDSEFAWQAQHQTEFEKIKCAIKDSACCASYDENLPLELETDASSYGLGACLKQGKKVISYASRCLSDTEKEYGQIEKEFLAVFFGCKKFHNYIYGRQVIVKSDHKPLESIMLKDLPKIGSRRLQRLRLKLYKYDLQLDYKPGSKIPIADYLSRYTNNDVKVNFEEEVMKQMVHTVSISDEKLMVYQNETSNDSVMKLLIDYYQKGWPSDKTKVPDDVKNYYKLRNDIYVSQGLVFYQDRLVVPNSLREQVLVDLHEGHMGITKTLKLAKESLYWPSMAQSIENLVSSCEMCNKFCKSNRKEPIIQHEIPPRAFEKVGCDIMEFNGKNYLVLVDYFSKWICCKPLSSKTSSSVISKWIEIFSEHGVPKEIIADNMPFSSKECVSFAKEWDIVITTSSPHYPQSNGLAEKSVGIIKNFLRKTKDNDQLYIALMNYNNTPLSDIELSPSQLSQNRRMRTKIVTKTKSLEPSLNKNVVKKFEIKNNKTKYYYNKNAFPRKDFEVSDRVWLQKQDGTWSDGQIIAKLKQPRSYEVLLSNGSVFRRNSKFLRFNKSTRPSNLNNSNTDTSIDSDIDTFFEPLHPPQAPNTTIQNPQQENNNNNIQNASHHPEIRKSSRIPKPVTRYGQT